MKKTTMLNIPILIAAALVLPGKGSAVYAHDDEDGHVPVAKGAVTYSADIKPVFEKRCTKCHGHDSPEHSEFEKNEEKYKAMKKGPRLDSYTRMLYFIAWPDTGALMRKLDDGSNTPDGKPGKMYKNLGNTEKERQRNLNTFKKWIGNWMLKRWAVATKIEDCSRMAIKKEMILKD